jgi:hypothetical protein
MDATPQTDRVSPMPFSGVPTMFTRNVPPSEAFIQHHNHRVQDANRRLKAVETAAARRADRLRRMRVMCHAAESRRVVQTAAAAIRTTQHVLNVKSKAEERRARADERRAMILAHRVEVQRLADAKRAAVRERFATLKKLSDAFNATDFHQARNGIRPLSDLFASLVPPQSQPPVYGSPSLVRFPPTVHGRYMFNAATTTLQETLTRDRSSRALPRAASDLIDVLLMTSLLPLESPQRGFRTLRNTAECHAGNREAMERWQQLHDAEVRERAAILVVASHYTALEAFTPLSDDTATAHQRPPPMNATQCRDLELDVRLVSALRELIQVDAAVASPIALKTIVASLLDAVVDKMEHAAAAEAARREDMCRELTRALVELRVGEALRRADIRRSEQLAASAGPRSPQALRERQVAPRRSILTSAVAHEITRVTRQLQRIGGADAVTAAEAVAASRIAELHHVDENQQQ